MKSRNRPPGIGLVRWAPQDLDAEHGRMSKEMAKQKSVGVKQPKTVITGMRRIARTWLSRTQRGEALQYVLVRLKGGLAPHIA